MSVQQSSAARHSSYNFDTVSTPSYLTHGNEDKILRVKGSPLSCEHTMIVPYVYHWNLGVGHAKETLREPHRVPFEVESLQLLTHGRRKVSFTFMMWILDLEPFPEKWALIHDSVIIDLVPSTNHDMKWSSLMTIEHITPKRVRPREIIRAEPSLAYTFSQGI